MEAKTGSEWGKWRRDGRAGNVDLGGGANPAEDDGIEYDPNIIDVILEGDGQALMLSEHDVAGHTYAQLTGFEMPEVPQQIFGIGGHRHIILRRHPPDRPTLLKRPLFMWHLPVANTDLQ